MTLPLVLRIGWRELWRRPWRTLLGALTFAIGVCLLVLCLERSDAGNGMLAGVVLAMAALTAVQTVGMSVMERRRELGLLAALGMRPVQIAATVLVESLLLTGLGGLLGGAAGWGLRRYIAAHGLDLALAGMRLFIPAEPLRSSLLSGRAGTMALLVGAVALLAGLYPAVRAARVQPLAITEG